MGGRTIVQPLELRMSWIIYEFCYGKVTKWRNSLVTPYGIIISHETFQFFRYNHKRQRLVWLYVLRKVSRGIFHGIPLESDRLCSTCRNGQIAEDVRKNKFDFPRGYQTFFRRICRISEDILFNLNAKRFGRILPIFRVLRWGFVNTKKLL